MEGRFDIPSLADVTTRPLSAISEGPLHGCNGLSIVSSRVRPSIVCEGPDMFPGCLSNFTSYLLRGARAIQTE